jgi:nucleotide-binding universal stress UspA family protein
MPIMKKILVPCDFSLPALEAVKFAALIATKNRSEVVLLHTIQLPALYDSSTVLQFEADFMKDTKEKSAKALDKIKVKLLEGVKTQCKVEFGGLLPNINDIVKKLKIDLIVMGTHGASGLKEYTVGSNAEKVVRNSTVPVISVRQAPKQIKNIVFPTQPDLDQEELTMHVKALQDFFGAKLHVVYVNTPAWFKRDIEMRPALEKFAKRFMLKNTTVNIFNDISQEEGIIHFTKAVKADMVALRTHGRKGIAHLANNSIAEDVVNHISCPVWTLKIK